MTQLSNRRILTLPAVPPCEAISPATLLHSLIALCRAIGAYNSDSFPIHRRMVRESFRQVGILLAFFEEIRDHESAAALPISVVLAFSEIHIALQKLRYLVYDCSRRGARVWIMMMSDRVSSEFRHLARSISAALDVLPLASMDSAVEIQEFVRLLTMQAWKVVMETDPEDCRTVTEIRSILIEFENGVAPSPAVLRRVLNRLRIRSWSECTDEISFLEEEFFAHRDDCVDGKSALLSSLMGFMAYCRASLFDVVDRKKISRKECKSEGITNLACLNPEDLRCPISLDIMADPVTISTGHTYDRRSIEKWFATGNVTCPVTGEKVATTELIPNSVLRKIITQFCSNSNIPIPEQNNHSRNRDVSSKNDSPGSSAAAGAARLIAALLVDKLATGDGEDKNKAAYEIRILCKSILFNRACLVEAGSVPWLLHLLYSSDPSIQENSVAALLNLSKHPDGRKAISESGGLALVVEVMREGLKVECQQNAAAILFYMSSVVEYRREIGEIPEAIPTLMDLLRGGTYRGKKNVLVTLFGLLVSSGNHRKILESGAIPILTDLLSSERDDLINDSVAVLAKLAERYEGTAAILNSSAVPQLVEVLRRSTSRSGREHCVSTLLSLCNNGGDKVVGLLEKMPLLMPSLYSLVTEGSPQAGKKARSLLNHIHRLHENDYPAMSASLCP